MIVAKKLWEISNFIVNYAGIQMVFSLKEYVAIYFQNEGKSDANLIDRDYDLIAANLKAAKLIQFVETRKSSLNPSNWDMDDYYILTERAEKMKIDGIKTFQDLLKDEKRKNNLKIFREILPQIVGVLGLVVAFISLFKDGTPTQTINVRTKELKTPETEVKLQDDMNALSLKMDSLYLLGHPGKTIKKQPSSTKQRSPLRISK